MGRRSRFKFLRPKRYKRQNLYMIPNYADSIDSQKKVFKKDQVGQVNPPKFDCADDMANLTYLNDACVLWNSVVRYKNELIYTYSGLFCIAINPYKRFPIYTLRAMEIYMG